MLGYKGGQAVLFIDFFAVNLCYDIAFFQAGLFCRAAGNDKKLPTIPL
jgi:hypothetical protein